MSSYQVTVDCDSGNGYDGRLGLRISSVFVIGFGSMCGMCSKCNAFSTSRITANLRAGVLLPIAAARTKRMRVPPLAFFITKYFGSGVIIATAFIHVSFSGTLLP
jgi:zinc transporter 1/2/3